MLGALVAWGCSEEPDGTPPGRVQDLRVTAVTETTAALAWTAPGERRGARGTAAAYDLRYTLGTLPDDWETAQPVGNLSQPQAAGSQEAVTVAGLGNDQVYCLAVSAVDEAGSRPDLSNVVQAHTGDPGPPGAITDLRDG